VHTSLTFPLHEVRVVNLATATCAASAENVMRLKEREFYLPQKGKSCRHNNPVSHSHSLLSLTKVCVCVCVCVCTTTNSEEDFRVQRTCSLLGYPKTHTHTHAQFFFSLPYICCSSFDRRKLEVATLWRECVKCTSTPCQGVEDGRKGLK